MVTINQLSEEIHNNAKNKGFFDEPKNIGEMLCLIHSEVSEALEADRIGNNNSKEKYFKERINTCPNSLHVLNQNDKWDAFALEHNHKECVKKLKEHYSFHEKMNILSEAA